LPAQTGWLQTAARPFAILGLAGALGLAILPLLGPVIQTVIERAPLPHALRPKVVAATEHGLRGIRTFHNPRRLVGFVGLTVLIWCLDATVTVVGGAALGFQIPI